MCVDIMLIETLFLLMVVYSLCDYYPYKLNLNLEHLKML